MHDVDLGPRRYVLQGRLESPCREASDLGTPVAEKVVQTFLWTPFHFAARDDNAAICKTFLFAYLIVCPARGIEFRQDVEAAGIGFSKKSHSSLVSVWPAMITDGSNSRVLPEKIVELAGANAQSARSNKPAAPWPPPTHMVTTP
jgi:hypothetical protein